MRLKKKKGLEGKLKPGLFFGDRSMFGEKKSEKEK